MTLSDDGENWAAMGWTPTGPRQVSKNTSYEEAIAKALSHARSIIDGSVRENDEWTAAKLVQQTTFWRAISPTTAIEPISFENLVHDHPRGA